MRSAFAISGLLHTRSRPWSIISGLRILPSRATPTEIRRLFRAAQWVRRLPACLRGSSVRPAGWPWRFSCRPPWPRPGPALGRLSAVSGPRPNGRPLRRPPFVVRLPLSKKRGWTDDAENGPIRPHVRPVWTTAFAGVSEVHRPVRRPRTKALSIVRLKHHKVDECNLLHYLELATDLDHCGNGGKAVSFLGRFLAFTVARAVTHVRRE